MIIEEQTGEEIVFVDDTSGNISVNKSVSDFINLTSTSFINYVYNISGTENININDLSSFSRQVLFEVYDNININDNYLLGRNVVLFANDNINIEENQQSNLITNLYLEDTIRLGFSLILDGQQYYCYCINTENNALTRYENYDFESFFQYKNKYYGVKNDGIYLLEGKTDNGNDIYSKFKTGFFNTANLETKSQGMSSLRLNKSRLDSGYAIIKNDGQVIFRIFNDSGEKFDYSLKDMYNNEKFRFNIGRGNRGSYYQLEVETVGNFKLDECVIIPVILERKV